MNSMTKWNGENRQKKEMGKNEQISVSPFPILLPVIGTTGLVSGRTTGIIVFGTA